MLTASHMPYQNNGMKFFTAEGGLAKPDITDILAAAAEKAAAAGIELGDGLQVGHLASIAWGAAADRCTGAVPACCHLHQTQQYTARLGYDHPRQSSSSVS